MEGGIYSGCVDSGWDPDSAFPAGSWSMWCFLDSLWMVGERTFLRSHHRAGKSIKHHHCWHFLMCVVFFFFGSVDLVYLISIAISFSQTPKVVGIFTQHLAPKKKLMEMFPPTKPNQTSTDTQWNSDSISRASQVLTPSHLPSVRSRSIGAQESWFGWTSGVDQGQVDQVGCPKGISKNRVAKKNGHNTTWEPKKNVRIEFYLIFFWSF